MNITTQDLASQLPVIAGHEIAMDQHGRFNLNAIHHASGTGKGKMPSNWARSSTAIEQIQELESNSSDVRNNDAPVIESHIGRNGGTFAHELLAVSYAGWISPKFQLQVNQVFIEYRVGKLSKAPLSSTLIGQTVGTDGFHMLGAVIHGKVNQLPSRTRKRASRHLWAQVHKAFSVTRGEDIPADQIDNARNFIAAYAMEGEWLGKDSSDSKEMLSATRGASPNRTSLNLSALRDYRIFAAGHMRKLTLSLVELNKLAETLPTDHTIHIIAHQVREVVRCSRFADEVVYRVIKQATSSV